MWLRPLFFCFSLYGQLHTRDRWPKKQRTCSVLGPTTRGSRNQTNRLRSLYVCFSIFVCTVFAVFSSFRGNPYISHLIVTFNHKFQFFRRISYYPNPRYCRFNRWLLYFDEWSGTVTNKERKKERIRKIITGNSHNERLPDENQIMDFATEFEQQYGASSSSCFTRTWNSEFDLVCNLL